MGFQVMSVHSMVDGVTTLTSPGCNSQFSPLLALLWDFLRQNRADRSGHFSCYAVTVAFGRLAQRRFPGVARRRHLWHQNPHLFPASFPRRKVSLALAPDKTRLSMSQ